MNYKKSFLTAIIIGLFLNLTTPEFINAQVSQYQNIDFVEYQFWMTGNKQPLPFIFFYQAQQTGNAESLKSLKLSYHSEDYQTRASASDIPNDARFIWAESMEPQYITLSAPSQISLKTEKILQHNGGEYYYEFLHPSFFHGKKVEDVNRTSFGSQAVAVCTGHINENNNLAIDKPCLSPNSDVIINENDLEIVVPIFKTTISDDFHIILNSTRGEQTSGNHYRCETSFRLGQILIFENDKLLFNHKPQEDIDEKYCCTQSETYKNPEILKGVIGVSKCSGEGCDCPEPYLLNTYQTEGKQWRCTEPNPGHVQILENNLIVGEYKPNEEKYCCLLKESSTGYNMVGIEGISDCPTD